MTEVGEVQKADASIKCVCVRNLLEAGKSNGGLDEKAGSGWGQREGSPRQAPARGSGRGAQGGGQLGGPRADLRKAAC